MFSLLFAAIAASSAGSGAAPFCTHVQCQSEAVTDSGNEQRWCQAVGSAQVAVQLAVAESEEKTRAAASRKSTNRRETGAEAHPKRRQNGAAPALYKQHLASLRGTRSGTIPLDVPLPPPQ